MGKFGKVFLASNKNDPN
jgi:calcium-dependent protein kinase